MFHNGRALVLYKTLMSCSRRTFLLHDPRGSPVIQCVIMNAMRPVVLVSQQFLCGNAVNQLSATVYVTKYEGCGYFGT